MNGYQQLDAQQVDTDINSLFVRFEEFYMYLGSGIIIL